MQENNKRIAKNTLFLYLRSIIIMSVSIYTSRVVLDVLGINDYGIYNIVGGFVSMFSILSSSMVNASQRFISFEMGRINPQMKKVFSTTYTIHLLLAITLFILLEIIGVWFLNNKINISPDRLYAANWVFHCSVITFCVHLLNIPYTATIIAHEQMSAFAYISIFEVIAKLLVVYALVIFHYEKLIVYAVLMMTVAVILNLIYTFFCRFHYLESRFSLYLDRSIFRSMLSFSGWNFIGSTAGIMSTQGINLLVNIFFGVTLNAARGVAEQVNHAVHTFVTNFMTAINPQITKNYAARKYDYMNELIIRGAKYGALLFWLISLTLFVEADVILAIWLVEVPPYAAAFLRLVIIYSIFQSLSNTLYIGMLATGHIKKYQIIMGSLTGASFILCYLFFKLGFGPEWSYISVIISAFVCLFARLWLLESMIPEFSGRLFFKDAIAKSFMVVFLSLVMVFEFKMLFRCKAWQSLLLTFVFSIVIVSLLSYFIAFDEKERHLIRKKLQKYRAVPEN